MDEDLVTGWLKGEGIINHLADIKRIGYKQGDDQAILVDLADHIQPGQTAAQRLQLLSAACGACGRSDLEAVLDRIPFHPRVEGLSIDSAVLFSLPATLSARQAAFAATGGLHACALFDPAGNLLLIREDIGRHNALDKLIGAAMMQEEIDFRKSIVLLSGRAGFELVQKAAMAGIAVLAAIGAPSSLALEVAREAGIALVGFLKQERFNIYHDQYSIIR
jgi:FdhD protein